MNGDGDMRRALQRIQAPDELDAQRRAWSLARAAFEAREPLSWERRHRGRLLAAAAVAALLAAAISPPGRALVGSVRDAVTDEKVTTQPALTSLPASGRLLVNSKTGPWIVQADGSKRPLGTWWQGAWSPNAEFVVVTRQREVAALDPEGNMRWSIGRSGIVRGASWSSEVNPARHADRLSERTGAQSRRWERPGGQGASSTRRDLCSCLAAGSVRAGLLDGRRPDRARRRRECEDGLANRPG